MTVFIIGAGPGDPDLITLKGARYIEECPVILYTGSLVPKEVISRARSDAKVYDSAGMTLDDIMEIIETAHRENQDVARVHTGDPSIFGSTAEQMRRMQAKGIPYQVIPGVSSFVAAAAAVSKELTLPELSQTVIVSRAEGRTPMPELESLPALASHKSTLCLFLSITLLKKVVRQIRPIYGEDCPIVIVHKASCPEEKIVWGTLKDIEKRTREAKVPLSQSMIIVGHVLTAEDFKESRLYAADFTHRFRKGIPSSPETGPTT